MQGTLALSYRVDISCNDRGHVRWLHDGFALHPQTLERISLLCVLCTPAAKNTHYGQLDHNRIYWNSPTPTSSSEVADLSNNRSERPHLLSVVICSGSGIIRGAERSDAAYKVVTLNGHKPSVYDTRGCKVRPIRNP